MPTQRDQHLYTDLARTVRESGLMGRRHAWYWRQIVTMVGLFAVLWGGVALLGDSWWQLVLAAALGAVMTQFGFLGHDAAHQQVFASATWNAWVARLLAGLFAGLSYGWWREKHNRHHANPNREGRDPDVGPGLIAFTPSIAASRSRGAPGWFVRRQGWLFFPLLSLEGLNLQVAGVRTLLGPDRQLRRHRRTELLLALLGALGPAVALLALLPPGKAVAFWCVQMAVFGCWLGGSFAPNHKGMPIVPASTRVDFLRRQVLMSRNVSGGLLLETAMGGLNHQIEHHLFPSMPRPNLRRVKPVVREYCEAHDVAYAEVSLLVSYGIVVDYLNHVGLRARDPFQCPLAADLRT